MFLLKVFMNPNEKSYVRFSTVPFNLDSLDNQIHLTNNAIQKNYDLSNDCHEEIPEEKMWYCDELDDYLQSLGYGNAFDEKIFPAMKDILIQTCLAGQETAEPRKKRFGKFSIINRLNSEKSGIKKISRIKKLWQLLVPEFTQIINLFSFELYGADFMLDEDLNPLLIEINQGPTLSIATAVTKDLVEKMLEDICKIVLDKQRDSEAGDFIKIFRQPIVSLKIKILSSLIKNLHR